VARFRSGERLRRWLEVATRGSVRGVSIGWVRTARYPSNYPGRGGGRRKPRKNPPYAASVAAWNEWGTKRGGRQHAPPRPFIQPSIKELRRYMPSIMRRYVDPRKPVIDKQVASLIGMRGQSITRRRIIPLIKPPNAPSTNRMKGSSNPLVDTGFLGRAVSWKVDE